MNDNVRSCRCIMLTYGIKRKLSHTHAVNGVRFYFSVVILCASPEWVRKIMLKAADKNFDNGEYVFFNIDLFGK